MAFVRVYYKKDEVENTKVDLNDFENVCSIHINMDNKTNFTNLLDHVFKLFNWQYSNFGVNDYFTQFRNFPTINRIQMKVGDLVKTGRKFYMKTENGWDDLGTMELVDDLYLTTIQENKQKMKGNKVEVKSQKVNKEPKANKVPKAPKQSPVITSTYIEGDIIKINGVQKGDKVILTDRLAQVMGYGKNNNLKVTLLDKNGKLQGCVISVNEQDLELYKRQEELQVV